MATVRFTFTAPDGVEALTLAAEGRELLRSYARVDALTFDSGALSPGAHELVVTVLDRRGASASDRVSVTTRNVEFNLVELTPAARSWRNGDEVRLDLTYTGRGNLSAEFSALDSLYDAARVAITDDGAGRATVRYRLSAGNARPDGLHEAVLTAADRATPSLARTYRVPLRLANTPRFPLEVPGGVFSAAPSAVTEAPMTGPPRIEAITGDARISPGRSVRLEVFWTARPTSPITALRVSAAGHLGVWTLRVTDRSATRATLTLTLPDSLDPGLPAGTFTVQVRAVDETLTASAARAIPLTVEDLGRGGPSLARVRGNVDFIKRIVAQSVPCSPQGAFDMPWPLTTLASVRALRESDGSVLDASLVGSNGRYSLTFMAPPAGVRVIIELTSVYGTLATPDIQVHAPGAFPYTFRSMAILAGPGTINRDLVIPRPVSAAFSILQTLGEVWDFTLTATTLGLPPVRANWAAGVPTTAACGSPISCYDSSASGGPTLQLGGQAADPDEWDDPVLRHEFGHFVANRLSRDDTPGGAHGPATRSDPRVAWSEGFASFWGASAANDTCYVNANGSNGGVSFRIDAVAGTALDTAPAQDPTGQLSEGVTSGILWQLTHTAGIAQGTASALAPTVWSIFQYLRVPSGALGDPSARVERGVAGADLTDYLYGWSCANACREAEARRIVVGTWQFNADPLRNFMGCPHLYTNTDVGVTGHRCSGDDVLALNSPMGLARLDSNGRTVRRTLIPGLPGGFLSFGGGVFQMALVRPWSPAPSRVLVTVGDPGSLAVASIVRGEEREQDTDQNPMTTSPGAAMGVTRLPLVPAGTMGTVAPAGVAVEPTVGRYAAVALNNRDEVAILDVDALALVRTVPVGTTHPALPTGVVFHPDGRRLFVALRGMSSESHEVAILTVPAVGDWGSATAAPAVTYLTDARMRGPVMLAVNNAGTRLGITAFGDDYIYVARIDTAPALERRINAAVNPFSIAYNSDNRLFFGHVRGDVRSDLYRIGCVREAAILGLTSPDLIERVVGESGIGNAVTALMPLGDYLYTGDTDSYITALPLRNAAGMLTAIPTCRDVTGTESYCDVSYGFPMGIVRSLVPLR
jgi:DNA-binding beta-propeller fold protein YncE